MSEDEGFLRRWSRRKQSANDRTDRDDAPLETPASATEPDAQNPAPEPEVDLSALPPVESIEAGTDIRGFLQKGVPLDLTRAALRRAWSEDPAIRDFIEVAENQWDFATGSDIPGFGALEPGTDVRRLVADIMGDFGEREAASRDTVARADQARAVLPSGGPAAAPDTPADDQQDVSDGHAGATHAVAVADGAVQQEAETDAERPQPAFRRHGSALPQ